MDDDFGDDYDFSDFDQPKSPKEAKKTALFGQGLLDEIEQLGIDLGEDTKTKPVPKPAPLAADLSIENAIKDLNLSQGSITDNTKVATMVEPKEMKTVHTVEYI